MKKIGNKIKQNAKAIAAFLLGIALTGGTVYAATILPSSQVGYDNSTSGLAATDVQGALDELYEKSERYCKPGFVYEIKADGYSCIHANNYITLTVKGAGNRNVFSSTFDAENYPNSVIINGNPMDTINYAYDLTDQNNTVTLVWYGDKISSTYSMFKNCGDITRIDLSNFDTSQVVNMKDMFNGTTSLTSLDLSNFDTSIVTDMSGMFAGASSLTRLVLSNFDTNQVTNMTGMFYGTTSLTSLVLSSFDTSQVTNMGNMFAGASSLTSLDLSNFNTSQVTNMINMFYGTRSLTSLDLSNFEIGPDTTYQRMFRSANPNLHATVRCAGNSSLLTQIDNDLGSGHYTCAN